MNTHVEKKQKQTSQTPVAQAKNNSTLQLVDNRPQSVIQQQMIQQMNQSSSEVAQLSGKGTGKNNKKQQKKKRAAATAKKSKQSRADRNAFRSIQYETTSKKDASAKQQAARKVKTNIAHGFGDKSKGKQGKTKQELAKINAELKLKKRQAKADKKKQDWLDRRDRHDRGGAGGGHGVLV
ncbi:hypothetical protein [Kordia jejudonensis]|uniref:hypothetical protein n=1 Tax=Kordia jejudonensis TaxID=1348245 RepID=UPI000629C751|nr:hypothetical protein [Kordia jejudonensis]